MAQRRERGVLWRDAERDLNMKVTIEMTDADRDAFIKELLKQPAVKQAVADMAKRSTDGLIGLVSGFLGG